MVNRNLRLFVWIFGAVGIALLVGAGIATWLTLDFRRRAVPASGVIVDLAEHRSSKGSRMYAPTYEFTDAAGQTHRVTASGSSSSPGYDIGEKVRLRYDPQHPATARLDGFMDNWFLPTLFGGMGLVFGGVAAGIVLTAAAGRRRRAELLQRGQRIEAKVIAVDLDRSLRVNGQHPWRIQAQWLDPQTQTMCVFHSETIWYDPSELVPETIGVWIDPQRPRRYWMDTDFLPVVA